MRIALLTQKGGAGKSTLAQNIACELARTDGGRTRLIDADPQGTQLDWAAQRQEPAGVSVVGFPRPTLHKEIDAISEGCAHTVIDGPGRGADAVTKSIALAVDLALIPVTPSAADLWATANTLELVEEATVFNEKLVSAFVVSRRIVGTKLGREVRAWLADSKVVTLNSSVATRVSYPEAMGQGLSVAELKPADLTAVEEIEELVKEIRKLVEA